MPSNRFSMGDSLHDYVTGQPLKDLKQAHFWDKTSRVRMVLLNEEKILSHRIAQPRGQSFIPLY